MIPLIVITLFILPAVIMSLYFLLLLLISFNISDPKNSKEKLPFKKMAIVIPAHNEEESIVGTLHSSFELDYPSNAYEVLVVADNCSDNTANLAMENGAKVFERNNSEARGKGYALKWIFEKLQEYDYEAYLVVDADCEISKNALQEINIYLNKGRQVLQINNLTSNPDDSPLSYTLAIGNYIENYLLYTPKTRLNMAVFLRGTGMVLTREVLEANPWEATSIAEDTDYTLRLISKNIPIYFIENASVRSPSPTTLNQLNTQRDRWAGGNLALSKSFALKMVIDGFTSGNVRLSDAGWTFLVNSKPLFLGYQSLAILISLAYYLMVPGSASSLLFSLAICAGLITLLYFMTGIIRMGITLRRFSLMIQSPVWIFNIFRITFRNFFGKSEQDWKKTPR